MSTPTIFFEEQERLVFVFWKPWQHERSHQIKAFNGGDFEVVCTCQSLDTHKIRTQIRSVIHDQLLEKKNQ